MTSRRPSPLLPRTCRDQAQVCHIEELRGIRKLDIKFDSETFAISGPNGSGESGLIDAIEFGLTGRISRLTGSGTKGLSLAEHGPHVDKTRSPGAALVTLRVFLTRLGKSVTITRMITSVSAKKRQIDPPDDDVKDTPAVAQSAGWVYGRLGGLCRTSPERLP
jgi:AAA domain